MSNLLWLEWERCEAGYRIEEFDPRGIDWTTSKEENYRVEPPKDASPTTIRLLEKWGKYLEPYQDEACEPFLIVEPNGESHERYEPFELGRGLFREFANTQQTPEGVKHFADRYGPLIEPTSLHAVSFWYSEIETFVEQIKIWENFRSSDLGSFVRDFNKTIFWREGRAPANVYMRETKDSKHPRLVVQPNNLLSAMWVEFALAVEGNLNYQKCTECPTWFGIGAAEVGHGKKYCSNACQMRAYRKRKKESTD